jgi:two-component system response regulator FixJ
MKVSNPHPYASAETEVSASTPQPTVYIVDDDQATRKSLRWLVETLGVPVQTYHCAVSFLDAYDRSMPGCLVLDMMMPGMNGLELQRELNERGIDIPVIVLTGYADVATAVRTLKGGAVEFLEKPFNDDVLLEQIRLALALDAKRRSERGEREVVRDRMARLTPRESEILDLVVEGLSSKEIAGRLTVSFKTVEAHRAKVMKKMEAESVAQLVRIVVSAKPSSDQRAQPHADSLKKAGL